jgi:hypothetical protein
MSQYGNAGNDRREGNSGGRRDYDPSLPAAYGTKRYWQEREAKANELIARGGTSAEVGRASWRNITKSTGRKPKK